MNSPAPSDQNALGNYQGQPGYERSDCNLTTNGKNSELLGLDGADLTPVHDLIEICFNFVNSPDKPSDEFSEVCQSHDRLLLLVGASILPKVNELSEDLLSNFKTILEPKFGS